MALENVNIRLYDLERRVKTVTEARERSRRTNTAIFIALIGLAFTGLLALVGASVAYGELRETAANNRTQLSEIRTDIRELRQLLQSESRAR